MEPKTQVLKPNTYKLILSRLNQVMICEARGCGFGRLERYDALKYDSRVQQKISESIYVQRYFS